MVNLSYHSFRNGCSHTCITMVMCFCLNMIEMSLSKYLQQQRSYRNLIVDDCSICNVLGLVLCSDAQSVTMRHPKFYCYYISHMITISITNHAEEVGHVIELLSNAHS